MDFSTILQIHKISVEIFFLIYLVKTALLLFNQPDILSRVTRFTKIPEMVISVVFLLTGVVLLFEVPRMDGYMIGKLLIMAVTIPLAIVAFKRQKKILALFSLFLLTMVFMFAYMSKMNVGSVEKTVVSGEELYIHMCSRCHGPDGRAGIMEATDLTTSALSQQETKDIIVNGKGSMPRYKKVLTEEQVSALVDYLMGMRTK